MDFDVCIIGAGASGLAAAREARLAGLSVVVLEAGDRPGGRARTLTVGHGCLDEGAQWIHRAEDNPLTEEARRLGLETRPYEPSLAFPGGAALEAFEAFYGRFEEAMERLAEQGGGGLSVLRWLETHAPELAADRWMATMDAWEGASIAAASFSEMDADDFLAGRLDGSNLHVPGGMGSLLLAAHGEELPLVRTRQRVRSVEETAGGFAVETGDDGILEARAVVPTVSVHAMAGIRWRIPAPERHALEDALDGLRMGALTKVFLHALSPSDDPRLDGMDIALLRHLQASDEGFFFLANPAGWTGITAFIGAGAARELDAADALESRGGFGSALGAIVAACTDELTRRLGGHQVRDMRLQVPLVSSWNVDPLFGGAYSHARPGYAHCRAALGRPLMDGRLVVAGEATSLHASGTVHGARLEGTRAGHEVVSALGATHAPGWSSR